MLSPGLQADIETFQRLEDFSVYSSCIKSFGKSIISPLLSSAQKEELRVFRADAIKREADFLERKDSLVVTSPNLKDASYEDHPCNFPPDFLDCGPIQNEFSTYELPTGISLHSSSSGGAFVTNENDMYVSISKIPSVEICSTIHTEVIISPTVQNEAKDFKATLIQNTSSSVSPHPTDVCHHFVDSSCHQYQSDNNQYNIASSVPYESFFPEQMSSVSEDEQSSAVDEAEFESLPTVIDTKKFAVPDTDTESNATCLTQSTDLEKYLDCSIEYSSADDSIPDKKPLVSSQVNTLSRSEDASSGTLVNTEGELTPCTSAMAQFREGARRGSESRCLQSPLRSIANAPIYQRAYSVDSYMDILKASRAPTLKKSQSEPAGAEGIRLAYLNDTTEEDNHSNIESVKSLDHFYELSNCDGDLRPVLNKGFKKGHVRNSSYTLDQPSPALLSAHADCSCKGSSSSLESPHSYASDPQSVPVSNPAFKKEQIKVFLPPIPDRGKFYPFLTSSSKISFDSRNDLFSSTYSSSSILPETESCISDALHSSSSIVSSDAQIEDKSPHLVVASEEMTAQAEDGVAKSLPDSSNTSSEDVQVFIQKILQNVQENQRVRVNQLIDMQNEQWMKLQEEFKEQERLLCEKLSLVDLPSVGGSSSDGIPPPPVFCASASTSDKSNCDSNPSLRPDQSEIYDSSYKDSSEISLPIQNKLSEYPPFVLPHSSSSTLLLPDNISNLNFESTKALIKYGHMYGNKYSASTTTEYPESSSDALLSLSSVPSSKDYEILNINEASMDRPDSSHSSASLKSVLDSYKVANVDSNHSGINSNVDQISAPTQNIHSSISDASILRNTSHYTPILATTNISNVDTEPVATVRSSFQKEISKTITISTSGPMLPLKYFNSSISAELEDSIENSAFNLITNCDRCLAHPSGMNSVSKSSILYDFLNGDHEAISDENNFSNVVGINSFQGKGNGNEGPHLYASANGIREDVLNSSNVEIEQFSTDNERSLLSNSEATTAKENGKISVKNSLIFPFKGGNISSYSNCSESSSLKNTKNEVKRSSPVRLRSDQKGKSQTGALHTSPKSKDQTLTHSKSSKVYANPSVQDRAPKQVVSTSLTNLKRKQSRDITKDPELVKKFQRLPALVKGYLTRRLFKTERVQDMVKTLHDTAILIGRLSEELNMKENDVSENDVDFHRQLVVQLMTTFDDLYDIFCTITMKEKMQIICESRNLRRKKTPSSKTESSSLSIEKEFASSVSVQRPMLSAATVKSLERKKRTTIDSRTYTIEDFKNLKTKSLSASMIKSRTASSPARIYKTSLGQAVKRKTCNVRKTQHWK